MIRAALRKMETAPTLCVGCMSFGFFFLALGLIGQTMPGAPREMRPVCVVLTVLCAAGWLVAWKRMRRAFGGQPGWGRLAGLFHLAGLLLTSWYPAMLGWAILVEEMGVSFPRGTGWVVFIVTIVALFWGLSVYRGAKHRIARMQRDAAVRIATEAQERALLLAPH